MKLPSNKITMSSALVLLIGLWGLGCPHQHPQPQGLLWATLNSDGKKQTLIYPHLFFDQDVLIEGGVFEGENFIIGKNKDNGKELWRWHDWTYPGERMTIFSGPIPVIDGIGVFINLDVIKDYTTIYGIDLEDGQTLWRRYYENDYSIKYSFLTGEGGESDGEHFYYLKKQDIDDKNFHLMKGDPKTGNEENILSFIVPPTSKDKHYRKARRPFIWNDPKTGDTMLSVGFSEKNDASDKAVPHLALVNLSKQEIIYNQAIEINDHEKYFELRPSRVVGNKVIFMLDYSIAAADVRTGKLIWVHSIPYGTGFGATGFGVGEGKVFVNPQNQVFYCLDLESGDVIWKREYIGGSVEDIAYRNRLIYFIDGSSIHVLDAKTGKTVSKLRSPDIEKFGGGFTGRILIIEDKLYVRSFYNLYCYPLSMFEKP